MEAQPMPIHYDTYTYIDGLDSVSQSKKDVTPLHHQWSYVFVALTHRYISFFYKNSISVQHT